RVPSPLGESKPGEGRPRALGLAAWSRVHHAVVAPGGEGAALVGFGDVVEGDGLLDERFGGGEVADDVGGAVAEAVGLGIVVPGAAAGRDAVDDGAVDVGMGEADGAELRQVAGADPDLEAARRGRAVLGVADADRQGADAGAVVV